MQTLNYFTILFSLIPSYSLCNASDLTINIRVNLPDAVKLTCLSGGGIIGQLDPQKPYHWIYPADKSESCNANWNDLQAQFIAYDPQSDQGHVDIYWNVEKDGLYRSWDNNNFEKKVGWN